MEIRTVLFCALAVFSHARVAAQTDQFKFHHLNMNHGLSHNQVTTVFKDSKGFVWIGTASGLNRFDSYTVRSFRHDPRDTTSLPHNTIISIFESPDGAICISTPLGLALYDRASEKFTQDLKPFYERYGISGTLSDIQRDSAGRFWFVEPRGIVRFDPRLKKNLEIRNIPGDTLSIMADSVSDLTWDNAGNYWVVHRNGILENLNVSDAGARVSSRHYYLAHRNGNRLFDYRVMADRDGDLWIMVLNDNQGVYYYSRKENKFYHFSTTSEKVRLNTNIIGGIVQDNNGLIWIGTDHGGINLIDKQNFTVRYLYHRDEVDKTLSENSVRNIYRDDQGIIWIGTYKRGVSYYHENIYRFNVYKHYSLEPSSLPFADVNRFVEDDNGNLWIGTNGAGLIYFDRTTETFRQYKHDPADPNSLSGDVIVSLCIDSKKRLWIGTYYEGLNVFDGGKFIRYKHNSSDTTSLSGRSVWEIFEDSKENIWIGTLEGGVNTIDPETGRFRRFRIGGDNAIQSSYIAAIMEDDEGNIWFGTGAGIDVYAPETGAFTHYESSASQGSLSNNNILDLCQDARGRIWIATSEGLNLFDPETKEMQVFGEDDGLPHSTILTILEDNQEGIWLGTPKGLVAVLVEEVDGSMGLKAEVYTESDGLQALQFNENAAYKTQKGELVFGGPYGFNIFNPGDVKRPAYNPRVVFTDFQLFQQSVRIGQEVDGRVILRQSITGESDIVLPPDKNFFSIEFSALDYLHPERTMYQYKLEGLGADWLSVDNNTRKITFTGLSPGEYTLFVRASNNNGVWTGQGSAMNFIVLPPFWKTKTAFIFYVLFLGVILYVARKLMQQREQMKFTIERERQEAIRMHELDMMKIKFFTNVSHEFRTPLTLIVTPLEKLLKQVNEPDLKSQYQLIQRNAKRLLNLVNQLLDFRKLEVQETRFNPSEGDILSFIRETVFSFSDLSEKKSIQLSFHSDITSLETIFDQDKLEKILFNLLSNAFKFTHEHGKVSVRVHLVHEGGTIMLQIAVEDTGIGIPPDRQNKIFERFFQNELPQAIVNQGSGIGLSITKEFVKVHGGRIELVSTPEKGSTFTVYIPVKEVLPVKISKEVSVMTAEGVLAAEEPIAGSEGKRVKPGIHSLLLVEDNDDFRFYLKDNLKLVYTIYEARNGREGWQQALLHQPDLIVSDIMMPEMNGIDLCRKIKNDERVSHIPVILLTARTGEERKLEGFEVGADEYIGKPFNFELLWSRIRNLISQREKSHKVFRKTLDVKASELNITPLDTKFIENAVKCVETNVASPEFSVEHLGRELGISRAYLYKKIRALTGKAPLEFIRTIRLQHAAQLLEKSQLTVSEVAYKVGFNNPKYFTRYFKEEFNVLPSHYAASRKKLPT